jgi:DNA-binding IscR family transcriptional regulator
MHGPVAARPLGRLLDFDCARLPKLYREFARCGVVRRDQGMLSIDPRFPAYAELMVLLRALGGERVIVIPDTSIKPRPWTKTSDLFGSSPRTRLLIALALLGSATIGGLSEASHCSGATTRSIVGHFMGEGILQQKREAPEIIVSFCERFPHRALLLSLLTAMAAGVPSIRSRVALVRGDIAPTNDSRVDEEPARLPFGTRIQSALLVELAARPATTRSIADATGISMHTVRTTLDMLASYGLIVTTVDGRGRGAKRWAALNDAHPLTAALKEYARPLARRPARIELAPEHLETTVPVCSNHLPGLRELRAAVLLDIVEHGPSSPSAVAQRLHIPRKRVEKWALDLAAADLVAYGERRGRMTIELPVSARSACHFMALLAETKNFLTVQRR